MEGAAAPLSAPIDAPEERDPETAQSIMRSLRRIQQIIGAQGRRAVERYEVTMPQLLFLRQLGSLGTTTPSAVARRLGVSQATVSGMIDRLEARGHVERSRSARDRRKVMLDLTAQGRALVAEAPLPLQERLADALARRSPRWCATIDLVLSEIVEMMGETGPGADAPPLLAAEGVAEPPPPRARFPAAKRPSSPANGPLSDGE